MPACCAFRCKNKGVHRFPKDNKRRDLWLEALRVKNCKLNSSNRLCGDHFKRDDYYDESFYTGLKLERNILKRDAVPSIFSFNKQEAPKTRSQLRLEDQTLLINNVNEDLNSDISQSSFNEEFVSAPDCEMQQSYEITEENLDVTLLENSSQSDKIFEMPLSNAEKCKNYRNRKKDAKKEDDNKNQTKEKSAKKTNAEYCRTFRQRKKMLAQGYQTSTNEVLYTPSTSNSQMSLGPTLLPVTFESTSSTVTDGNHGYVTVKEEARVDDSQITSGSSTLLVTTETGSLAPEKEKDMSWRLKNETLDIPKDEPEQLDDVSDNLPLYYKYYTASVMINENNDGRRHDGFQCDNCNGDIIGYRYTCVQCSNLDLCVACETAGVHAHHYMLRVPGPRPYNEIQTVLMTIRNYLMKELDPISSPAFDDEETISVKSELVEHENADENVEEVVEQVGRTNEDAVTNDLRQHCKVYSHGSRNLNTNSNQVSENNRPVQLQMMVPSAKQATPKQKSINKTINKSEKVPVESRLKILNANDINRSTMIVAKEKRCEILPPPSTAKRKIVIDGPDLDLEQTCQLPKKIYLVPNSNTQNITILTRKS